MNFRSAYSGHVSVGLDCGEVSMTKQSFKDECDINNIINKYHKTGLIDFVDKRSPSYGDFSGFDFAEAMQTVAVANEMFAELPANIRRRFQDDPVEFVQFVSDENNRDEAMRLGLLNPPVTPAGGVPAGGAGGGQAGGASGGASGASAGSGGAVPSV